MTVRFLTAMLLAPVLLVACQSAPTRVHTLFALPATAPLSRYAGPPIRVDTVHVPPDLDHIEIISRIAPGELRVHDLDHWSAPLGQIARQALSADLVARLPPGRVIFPHLAKPADALGISVDILAFTMDPGGTQLEAGWTVNAADPKVAPRRHAGTLKAAGAGGSGEAIATTLSTLLAQLSDLIVAGLLEPDKEP